MNYLNILVTIKTRTRRTFLSRRTSSGYNTSPLRGYKIFTNLFYQDIRWRKKDMKKTEKERRKDFTYFHLRTKPFTSIWRIFIITILSEKLIKIWSCKEEGRIGGWWHLEVAKINRWIFFTWIAYSFCLIRWRLDRVKNR